MRTLPPEGHRGGSYHDDPKPAMVDVPPDDLKHCHCKTAFLYVHPDDYKPDGDRTAQEAWVRVAGKHRNKEAAWNALHGIISVPGHWATCRVVGPRPCRAQGIGNFSFIERPSAEAPRP